MVTKASTWEVQRSGCTKHSIGASNKKQRNVNMYDYQQTSVRPATSQPLCHRTEHLYHNKLTCSYYINEAPFKCEVFPRSVDMLQ